MAGDYELDSLRNLESKVSRLASEAETEVNLMIISSKSDIWDVKKAGDKASELRAVQREIRSAINHYDLE